MRSAFSIATIPTRTWFLGILVSVGLLGLFTASMRAFRVHAPCEASGRLWQAVDQRGQTLQIPRPGRIPLKNNTKVVLDEEGDELKYRSVSFVLVRDRVSSLLELDFRETDVGCYHLKLAPAKAGGVALVWKSGGGNHVLLANVKDKDYLKGTLQRTKITLDFQDERIALQINGEEVFRSREVPWTPGSFTLKSRGGLSKLLRLEIKGAALDEGGTFRTFTLKDDFSVLPRLAPWADFRVFAFQVGIVLVGLFLLLRALCLGKPGFKRLVRAFLLLLAPASLYYIPALFLPLDMASPVVLLLFAPGFIMALFALRGQVRDPEPEGFIGRLRSILVGVAAAGLCAFAAGEYRVEFHDASRKAETVAAKRTVRDPFILDEPRALGPHNALVVNKQHRNFDLKAGVTLEENSILQVRLRAFTTLRAEGIALLLSSDRRQENRFHLETVHDFKPIGEGSAALPAAVPLTLELRARGRTIEAFVNGALVATAEERLFAEGGIVFLTLAGRAEVKDLSVEPVVFDEASPSATSDWIAGAVRPLIFLLVYSLLCALLLRVHFLRALEVNAIGLVPLAYCFFQQPPSGTLEITLIAVTLFAAGLIFLLLPMVHTRNLTLFRYTVLVATALAGCVWAYHDVRERTWPHDTETLSRLTLADWSVDHLERKFAHFQVPELRRWNHYLARHELRDRSHRLKGKEGTTRILALGTSSTYGYRVKTPYPFRLEKLLAGEGYDVEVLNGAFQGASGTRLFPFVKNVLMEFSPDIVTLSLFNNDSYALNHLDEAAYLERVTHPYYRRSLVDDLVDRVRMWLDAKRTRQMVQKYDSSPESVELDPEPAAARFEAVLRTYAELAEERGFDLVLIKEPIAWGKDRLLKRAFYAAMDRVGREYGIPVVNPTPVLNQRGGDRLFRDHVHTVDEGDAVMAEVLAPVIRKLIDMKENDG